MNFWIGLVIETIYWWILLEPLDTFMHKRFHLERYSDLTDVYVFCSIGISLLTCIAVLCYVNNIVNVALIMYSIIVVLWAIVIAIIIAIIKHRTKIATAKATEFWDNSELAAIYTKFEASPLKSSAVLDDFEQGRACRVSDSFIHGRQVFNEIIRNDNLAIRQAWIQMEFEDEHLRRSLHFVNDTLSHRDVCKRLDNFYRQTVNTYHETTTNYAEIAAFANQFRNAIDYVVNTTAKLANEAHKQRNDEILNVMRAIRKTNE